MRMKVNLYCGTFVFLMGRSKKLSDSYLLTNTLKLKYYVFGF